MGGVKSLFGDVVASVRSHDLRSNLGEYEEAAKRDSRGVAGLLFGGGRLNTAVDDEEEEEEEEELGWDDDDDDEEYEPDDSLDDDRSEQIDFPDQNNGESAQLLQKLQEERDGLV